MLGLKLNHVSQRGPRCQAWLENQLHLSMGWGLPCRYWDDKNMSSLWGGIWMCVGVYGCRYSSPPSAAYMRQWIRSALVQIMACRLFGAKPLFKPMLSYCQLDPKEQTSLIFNRNTNLFINQNASENIVCEMATILSRGRWVKVWTCSLISALELWRIYCYK